MEHIHFIGIGGTGLSAIAKVLLEQGYKVSGSDLSASPLSDAVKLAGGTVYVGHHADQVQGADLVIKSSAIPDQNVEVQAAIAAEIPVMKRADFLNRLVEGKEVTAVAGSHGKTTTTSMIAWILTALEKDPSYIVGGVVSNLGTNASYGSGSDFVIEADEYDYMFLGLSPTRAVITNVEHDHPDLFPTAESFQDAFREFVRRLQPGGTLILCGEDQGAMNLQNEIKNDQQLIVYGFEETGGDYIAKDLVVNLKTGMRFQIISKSERNQDPVSISLQIPGRHNVLNALGAFAAADQMGLPAEQVSQALSDFKGSERRFEIRGEYQGILIIDDYAHHPTEIMTSLAAASEVYPNRRIWAVWQPHTYTRTDTLFSDYINAFIDADKVIILDVYAAREKKPKDFNMSALAKEINHPDLIFIPNLGPAFEHLHKELTEGDLVLVFTAGDAIDINDRLEKALSH